MVPHGGGAPGDAANSFAVTIEEMEFLGSFWRARLGGGPLNGADFVADFSINATRRLTLEEGREITIELPPARLKLFPPAPSAPS